MTADDRDPQDERFNRSSRRGNTDRLSPDDTAQGEPVNPNWRGDRTGGRARRARGNITGQDFALWLQYGGWRYVAAGVALLLVTAVMFILSQPAEPTQVEAPGADPPLTIRLTPLPDQPTITPSNPITSTQTTEITGTVDLGQRLRVTGTGDQGLFLRPGPNTDNPPIKTLPEGSIVTVVGSDETGGGYTWKRIRDETGSEGFAASNFLVPAE
jgi:hypothetical protein